MVLEYLPKKIRNNSFSQGLNRNDSGTTQPNQSKCHRSSVGQLNVLRAKKEDQSTKDSREDSLQKRLNQALEKTKSAFLLFESMFAQGHK